MTLASARSRPDSRRFANVIVPRALARFPATVRPKIASLAAEHRWLADLASTFPGLLAALATASPGPARDRAHVLVIAGSAMKEAARALRIPLWLRKLPPEAFAGRVPPLPLTDTFSCRVANLVPAAPERSAEWLHAVSEAWRTAGEPYALWVASHAGDRRLAPRGVPRNQRHYKPEVVSPLIGIGLFAWYSRTRLGPAGELIREPWKPSLGPTDARRFASAWLERVELAFATGDGLRDVWLKPGNVMGLDFVPLRTTDDVLDEAAVMRNCVASYGGSLGENYCRLWSLRCDGARVATVEIYRNQDHPVPFIAQMKGPGNTEVAPEIWRALYTWLASEPAWNIPVGDLDHEFIGRAVWHRTWLPYWRAAGLKPWLPIAPSRRALWQLMRTL